MFRGKTRVKIDVSGRVAVGRGSLTSGVAGKRRRPRTCSSGAVVMLVGDTGIEPVTSSVSGKRATAAPIARVACVDTTPGCC
jgi:hypothetical protein